MWVTVSVFALWVAALESKPRVLRGTSYTFRTGACKSISYQSARRRCGANNAFTLAPLDFSGTPAGIDIIKVVDTRILPVINTGIAHREPGVGQIGAGVTRAPMACFAAALLELGKQLAE